jgi:farnesyl diphosphate synthase
LSVLAPSRDFWIPRDDLLDAAGDAQAMGKATLVGVIGNEAARAQLAATIADAEHELRAFGDKANVLTEAAHFAASREH